VVAHPTFLVAAKGRTNIELREQFILAEGVSQSMAHFKSKNLGVASPGSSQTGSVSSGTTWSGYSSSTASGPVTKVSHNGISFIAKL